MLVKTLVTALSLLSVSHSKISPISNVSKLLRLSVPLHLVLLPTQIVFSESESPGFNIPNEISYSDSYMRSFNDVQTLAPNNDIVALDGALNLGGLLWGYVLYCGLFTNTVRPAELILPILAKLFSRDSENWYLDALEG